MKFRLSTIAALLIIAVACGQLAAQHSDPLNDDGEFVNQYNKRFESQKPLVGDAVLDGLQAFDEHGQPFMFDQLKGKHSVIVFGCLT
jgi:cytochrome oxidase Cu insertion factor (SCO1/SenC/PrrC family)